MPLGSIAAITEAPAALQITRVGQYPAATVGFDVAPGASLGAAVQAIRQAASAAGLPAALTLRFTGAAGAWQQSLQGQLWLIAAALVCVYIVLGVLYESYVHPLTILSTLPSAGVGELEIGVLRYYIFLLKACPLQGRWPILCLNPVY